MTKTVLLDNGHGKDTAGKRSPLMDDGRRLMEYEFNRDVAHRLSELLQAVGVKPVLIVPEVNDIALSTRAERVKEYVRKHPDEKCVFVSIHGNASGNGAWMKAQGWSAWTTPGQNESDKLAERLYDAFQPMLKDRKVLVNKADGNRDYEANFAVIRKAEIACPSVLTENFFMDNKDDCAFMLSEQGRDRIAHAHMVGILNYFFL